jgi:hypothetical protein
VSAADEAPRLRPAELVAMWDAQRTEVVTADIQCLCFNGSIENPGMTQERLAELVGEHDLAADAENLGPFLEGVLGGKPEREEPWTRMAISISGRRHRQDDGSLTFLSDGRYDFLVIPNNRQVSIYQPGQSSFGPYGVDSFRWTPPAPVIADRIRITHREGDASQIEFVPVDGNAHGPAATAVVDNASGIVTYKASLASDGSPLKERYQLGIKTYPGDIDWPTATLEARYAGQRLSGLRVLLILSARFNQSVPEERFVLGAARGTSVIDYRGADVAGFMAASDVADVQTIIGPVRQPGEHAGMPAVDSSVRRILLWFHAIFLFAGGIWFWKRKRGGGDSRP